MRNIQPQGFMRPDPTHPLSPYLVSATVGGFGGADLRGASELVAAPQGVSPRGRAYNLLRASSGRIFTRTTGRWTRMSVVCGVTHTNLSSSFQDCYASVRTAGNQGWTWGSGGAAGSAPNRTHGFRFTLQGVANYDSAAGLAGNDNIPTVIGMSFISGSNIRIYNRGNFYEQIATGSLSSPGTERLLVGAQGPGSSPGGQYFNGPIDWCFVFDGIALSDKWHKELALRPWQLFPEWADDVLYVDAGPPPAGKPYLYYAAMSAQMH